MRCYLDYELVPIIIAMSSFRLVYVVWKLLLIQCHIKICMESTFSLYKIFKMHPELVNLS